MAGIKYNEIQIEELKKNKYVKNISEKSITFSLECKCEFLKMSKKWIFYKKIFEKLGFPQYIIEWNVASEASKRWKRNEKNWAIEKKKWRAKKTKIDFNNMTLEQENEYLRAKLALYEALEDYMKNWSS